jgi:hypothetical protein
MTSHRPAAYICTCTKSQLSNVGCDCAADHFKVVEVDIMKLESGLYTLTFGGFPRGDAAKFDYRDARTAAASWDGKENGEWRGSTWQPIVYRCAWGAGRAA